MGPSLSSLPEKFARHPVLPLLALQILAVAIWQNPSPACVAVCLTLWLASGAACHKHGRMRRWAAFHVFTALSLGLYFHSLKPLSPALTPKAALYRATVASLPETRDGLTRAIVDLDERLKPAPDKASGRITLAVDGDCPFAKGSPVTFRAAVKEARAYKNPGVFDYRDFLRRSGIFGQAFVASCKEISADLKEPPGFFDRLQKRVADRLAAPDLKNGPVLSAMLIGTRTIGRDTARAVRDMGLSHLFAISGMQFGVMIAVVYGLLGLLTRLVPGLYLYWPRQKIAAAAALLFVAFYLLVAAPQASILRAGAMAAAFLVAVLTDRRGGIVHALLASASVLLLLRPADLLHVSFQLSYLCVFVLALVAGPLGAKLSPLTASWPRPVRFAGALAGTTTLLGFLLMPLLALDFGQTSPSGLVHNLWAIPVFDFVAVPLSLAFLAAFFVLPSAAEPPLKIWDALIGFFLRAVEKGQSWPWPNADVFPPHAEHALIFYAALFLFALTRRKSHLAFGAALLALSLGATYYRDHAAFDLRLTQIDVEQGDATLLQTPHKTLLVDAGGNARFDVGANVVKPFLKHSWIGTIDAALITHPDTDHYLGFAALLDSFDIGEAWVGAHEKPQPAYAKLLDAIRARGIPVRVFRAAEEIKWDEKISLFVMPPDETLAAASDNDRSLVLRVAAPGFSALLTGDISKKAERRLAAAQGEKLDIDLLKVAHHGSKYSTDPLFLAAASPRWAVIGVAERSQFGHPHPDVLKRLAAKGVEVLRTDLDGAVTFTLKNGKIEIEKFVAQPAGI